MKTIATYVSFFLLLLFLGFLYGFTSNKNGLKEVNNTVVEFEEGDNNFLTHSMVDKMLIQNSGFVKNQRKRVVNLHFLETNVLGNPYVEKATVYLTIDGVLKTLIKQRKPIARIVNEHASYYIDEFGVEIPLSSNFSARVPLISGVSSNAQDIAALIELIKKIENYNFFSKEIVAIQKNREKEYIFTVRSGSYKIIFGKLENEAIKFKKLIAFYNKALIDKTIKKYKTINVKYHNQVVCTKQKQDEKQ
ncbi:cell division protein FtsQ/DivIB [Tenacibaculum finnmarkense]|uniref:Cell division protein FtsQ n=1 Tax=Tenacibaculum finnmarkense genomovar finnmarkense TaxID=1458503 RepID=A0AAP1RGZ2_9FLAO|nr:cell division protein FtsQ/DivIB [Tenacibaculum finnmarkense]MBE7653539.1 cell division protein FtsQ [Tenacibaculum finnmarkense genomovar finnmarkense]MBE7695869.1 cell division protein FtsQ [Tenacibaculum finnmarkense genomovar finnmarkense]MCD8440071.1 cell division protein FtsQ/DivIB [Tenacibaculum finnmarkense genomovar ulcerans]MCG8721372.1 cell division protein FtsQ [Tenacibaculum finnmarkense]MCG8731755.1 cell division protein FtsQ [Tenacibaculum finnmarkense]